jgi:hypothetical protein
MRHPRATSYTSNGGLATRRCRTHPAAHRDLAARFCLQDCTTYPIQPCKFSELVLQNGSEDLNPVWLLNPKPNPSLKCHETIDILDASAQNVIFQ